MPEAFTTLANVKDWLNIANNVTTSNNRIQRLIYSATNAIKQYCSVNTFLYSQRTDCVSGTGANGMFLNDGPVQSILSLGVDGQNVAASSNGQVGVGYTLQPFNSLQGGCYQTLTVTGSLFNRGTNNVTVTYMAGFAALAEPVVVPAAGATVAVAQANGFFTRTEAVTYAASGVALTQVASAPTTGQFALDSTVQGGFKFAAADVGLTVLVSYSYVPYDLEQACIETVAERFRYMSRIGENSKQLGGQETVSYALNALNPHVMLLLAPYKQVVAPACY